MPVPETPDDNVETPPQVTRREKRERQQNSRRVYLDASTPQIRSIMRIVVVTLVLLFFAGWLQTIITSLTFLFFLLVVSIFFAYLIDPLVKLIRRPFKQRGFDRWMPRAVAIPIAYLLVFTIVGGIIAGIAPQVSYQAREFGNNLPAVARSIDERIDWIQNRFQRLRMPEEVKTELNRKATEFSADMTSRLGNLLIAFLSYLPWFILVPFLAFFILRDVNQFRLMVLRMFPVGRWRMRAELVMTDVNTTLAAYMRAQLISCVLIAILCTIGFYVIGLKYALLLGILAGIFEFVPLLGPATIGIIVTLTAAASDRPQNAIYVAIFLIVLRIVQDYVMYPRIIQGGIHLHPLAVILSVLAGEQVAGIPGVFISIPLVAIATVIYKHVLEHRGTPRGLVSDFIAEAESRPEEAV